MPLPAFARIVDARLQIVAVGAGVVSEVTRRRFAGPPATERIRIDLALSVMTPSEARAWSAWVEALEGRLGVIDIAMRSSLSPQTAATLSLEAAAGQGASRIVLENSSSERVQAGTMIAVGTQDGSQQVVMLLEDVAPGGTQSVEIAPRLR